MQKNFKKRIIFILGLFFVLLTFIISKSFSQEISKEILSKIHFEFYNYDKTLPLNPKEKFLKETAYSKQYKIIYESTHNEKVPAFFNIPKKGTPPFPCIIVMHGYTGDKSDISIAEPFTSSAGYATFAIDAQYHGERQITGKDIYGFFMLQNRDAIIQTIIDLRRAIDYLETRPEIDASRIGYVGGSMGGIMGALFAGVDERVKVPVLLVGGADWIKMIELSHIAPAEEFKKILNLPLAEQKKVLKEKIPGIILNNYKQLNLKTLIEEIAPADPIYFADKISPRPLLMQNGLFDELVPPPTNQLLFDLAKEPKHIDWYESGHGLPMNMTIKRIMWWFDTFLKPKNFPVIDFEKDSSPVISNLKINNNSFKIKDKIEISLDTQDKDKNLALVKAYFPFSNDEILLLDNGKKPDIKANDNIFSGKFFVPKRSQIGKFKVKVWAVDLNGKTSKTIEKAVNISNSKIN